MPETVIELFEKFYDALPASVHDDLSFMMVVLSDEDLVTDELEGIDEQARALFRAQTIMGRLSNLINAVSIFDVYFALNASERFSLDTSPDECDSPQRDLVLCPPHNRYADRIQAIRSSKQLWADLRRTTLSPEAIAAALVSTNSTTYGNALRQ